VGDVKKNCASLIALLVLALVLVPAVAACAITGGTTTTAGGTETTTTGGTETTTAANDPAGIANAAIAAVTKSANIATPQTIKAGVLQGGSDPSFPPMEFSNGKGGYTGFDIDLCTALAKKMGLTLEVVSTGWSGIIPALMADRFDIIMSAMSITPEGQQQIDFTDPYLPGNLAISTPTSAPITDPAGLAGKIVGVQGGTTGQSHVEALSGVKEIKVYNTVMEAFEAMAAGKVDAVVDDEAACAYILENNADFKAKFANAGTIVTDNGYGYGIKKGNAALLTAMNAALKELRADGVYQKICTKWAVNGN
jgi:ABC-type amino acid transport substrate-binding protein